MGTSLGPKCIPYTYMDPLGQLNMNTVLETNADLQNDPVLLQTSACEFAILRVCLSQCETCQKLNTEACMGELSLFQALHF